MSGWPKEILSSLCYRAVRGESLQSSIIGILQLFRTLGGIKAKKGLENILQTAPSGSQSSPTRSTLRRLSLSLIRWPRENQNCGKSANNIKRLTTGKDLLALSTTSHNVRPHNLHTFAQKVCDFVLHNSSRPFFTKSQILLSLPSWLVAISSGLSCYYKTSNIILLWSSSPWRPPICCVV